MVVDEVRMASLIEEESGITDAMLATDRSEFVMRDKGG